MKIRVSKIQAAKSQLIEAINLFFEERDPVSIHTLAAASLQILYDHFDEVEKVLDNNLMLHYNSIYVKDEHRREWINLVKEAQNFFKHADEDLRAGKTEIEFDPEINPFYLIEAIRCLRILEGENHDWRPEFRIFTAWFIKKNPNLLKDRLGYKMAEKLLYDADDLASYLKALKLIRNNPESFGLPSAA